MKKFLKILSTILIATLALTACSGGKENSQTVKPSQEKNASAEPTPNTDARTIKYFSSKAATDETIVSMQLVTEMYNKQGGNINLVVESAADRPSYDQKIGTMITGGQIPDMYDLDPTPFTQELSDAGLLIDMEAFLKEIGEYDSYIPLSINYGRLSDGKLPTLPLEFSTEMIWYNTDMYKECGLSAPNTFEELLNNCKVLSEKGYTPIAIAGADGWPVMRHIAMTPFRREGNEFLHKLAKGEAQMSDPVGMETLQFMAEIGKYYQTGFSSTDYSTAKNLLLSGKAAMYGIGTWELNNFIDENRPKELNLDYFYMPTLDGAVTKPNEYWAFGGIGLTVNPTVFDEEFKDYLAFIVKNYSSVYIARQHFAPQKVNMDNAETFDKLFLKIKEDIDSIGETACKPWDVVLNEDVIATLNDNLPGLCMGEVSPEEFAKIIDAVLAEHAVQ